MKRIAKAAAPAKTSAPSAKAPRSRLVRAEPPKPATTRPAKTAKGPARAAPRSLCPINLALELVGDAWTLLIVRDLMLRGHTGYQAFLRSGEKIATNILADRLLKLEQNGLITKSPDPADARKFIYALSDKGTDLAPILVELTLFSHKHEPRIDMPKDVLLDMQKNKPAFTQRLIRHAAPKKTPAPRAAKAPKADKAFVSDLSDETLSLF